MESWAAIEGICWIMISRSSLRVSANKISKCWLRQSEVEFIVSSLSCPQRFLHSNPTTNLTTNLHKEIHHHMWKFLCVYTPSVASQGTENSPQLPTGTWHLLVFTSSASVSLDVVPLCLQTSPDQAILFVSLSVVLKWKIIVEIWKKILAKLWEVVVRAQAGEHGREQRKEREKER